MRCTRSTDSQIVPEPFDSEYFRDCQLEQAVPSQALFHFVVEGGLLNAGVPLTVRLGLLEKRIARGTTA
jgi:hypothetical protein